MPDVLSFGLGGGSIVRDGGARIGPDSVGYEITSRALVFGGDTLTTTDVVVAAGHADIGDRQPRRRARPAADRDRAHTCHRMVDESVDRMKTSAASLPVILVGGGAILVQRDLPSASAVLRPEQAGGRECDRRGHRAGRRRNRSGVLAAGCQPRGSFGGSHPRGDRARDGGGRAPGSIEVVDIEEVPLAYLPSSAVRIRVKVVGDLVLRGAA